MDSYYVVSLFLFCLVLNVNCSGTGDALNKSNETLVGKALMDMGTLYNKPLLRLFGKSLINLECKLDQCGDWATWSSCKLFIGQYGMKSRTRQCGGNTRSDHCEIKVDKRRKEEEFEVCEEFCPSSYEMTREGFCLKLYNSSYSTKADAGDKCETDGGHLVNINSEKKSEAFSTLLRKNNCGICVLINGQRVDTGSPWTFTYEKYSRGYTNWASGQPDNATNELCMCGNHNNWHDTSCTSNHYYVCEIVPAYK